MTTPQDDATESSGVYTEESREVLRVRPSEAREKDPDLEDRIDQIASLHDLRHEPEQGIVPNLLGSNTGDPVRFEMLVLSAGVNEPVEIYYSSDDYLDTLRHRLDIIYPDSFDIERQQLDLGANLIRPVRYSPSEFLEELKAGNLAYDLEELLVDVESGAGAAFGGELESGLDREAEDGIVPVDDVETTGPPSTRSTPSSASVASSDTAGESESLSPTEAFDQAQTESSASTTEEFETETWARRDDVPSDHRFLRLPDQDGKAVKIDPSSRLDEVDSRIHLERPTFTEERDILARPSRDSVAPCAVRWRGKGNRKDDWMTTLRSDDTAGTESDDGYSPKPSVVSDLLVQLCEMEDPLVFQITFQARPSWSVKANSRKDDLRKGEDTRMEKFVSTITGPSEVDERSLPSEIQKRIDQIEEKNPQRTFDVNMRAVAVDSQAALHDDVADDEDEQKTRREQINSRLRSLCPEFDSMDGQFYEVDGTVVKEGNKISTGTASTPRDELDYLLDRELTTSADEESRTERMLGDSIVRSELVMNPRELSDFITIPPGEKMPKEAFRGIRAKHQEESPLPPPNPDTLAAFSDGMAVGKPLDKNRNSIDTRVEIPPSVLTTHYARFALTGFGKSISANNDIRTLHANTSGPVIVVDPKGDGMCYRYLLTHYAQFGDLDDVYYFKVPEDIPAASFFDIRPLLARGRAREDAIQDKVDHFHEIMEMVMGPAYSNAYVAIMVLTFLIKAMFDPEYGQDAFTIDDLYEQTVRMQREKRIPRISDERSEVEQSLVRHFENDDTSFKETMTAVLNRLDKIRENKHLYRIFNHIPEWDYQRQTYATSTPSFSFEKFFDEDAVVLFDIGDLRPYAAKAMTLILLSNLWDDLQQRDSMEDHTLVNLIIEEAAPFAATDLMAEQLFSKSRSFGLAMGLIMQYPGQVRDEGLKGNERAYNEIKNNVQSTLYGRIQDNSDLVDELATYSMDPMKMKTKLSSLRDGEWVADLPSPAFDAPVPSPFSMQALPIPEGHPEGPQPLSDADKRAFERVHLSKCRKRVQNNYSIQGAGQREDTRYTEPQAPEGGSEGTPPGEGGTARGAAPADGPASSLQQSPSDPAGDNAPNSETESSTSTSADPGEDQSLSEVIADSHSDIESDDEDGGGGTSSAGDEGEDGLTQTEEEHQEIPPETEVPSQEESGENTGPSRPEAEPDESSDLQETADEPGEGSPDRSADGSSESTTADDPRAESDSDPVRQQELPIGEGQGQESRSGEQAQAYHSVAEVYREAKEINTSCSGGERFQKLADLSSAAEDSDIDVDDDQLATVTDESDIPDVDSSSKHREEAGSGQSEPESETTSEDETDTEAEDSGLDPGLQKDVERVREKLQDRPDEYTTDLSAFTGVETDVSPDVELQSDDTQSDAQTGSTGPGDGGSEESDNQRQGQDQPGFSEQPAPGAGDVDLSEDDEELLHLILDAMNGELDEFSFTDLETMTDLVNQVDNPDVERLQELDYLEKTRVARRYFYTILPKGRAYLGRTLKNRDGVGDLGEKSPHKVGVGVLYQLFNHKRDDVDRVQRYQKVGDHKIDVVGYDDSGEIVAVGEAETPSNNHDAVVTDYEKMAEVDADAIWLCSSRETAIEVLDTLEQQEVLEDEFTPTDKKSWTNLKQAVQEKSLDGMTEVRGLQNTFSSVKDEMGDS